MRRRVLAPVVVAVIAGVAAPAFAQPSHPAASQTTQQAAAKPAGQPQNTSNTALPVDVDKIRTIVTHNPRPLNYEGLETRFYLRVDVNQFRFSNFVGHFDLLKGPVPRAGQTYAEFMQMVTPRELYSTAGIKPSEELEMALTGWLAQSLARKAIDEIKNARSQTEIQAIRDRITKELAALTGGG